MAFIVINTDDYQECERCDAHPDIVIVDLANQSLEGVCYGCHFQVLGDALAQAAAANEGETSSDATEVTEEDDGDDDVHRAGSTRRQQHAAHGGNAGDVLVRTDVPTPADAVGGGGDGAATPGRQRHHPRG